MANHAAKADAAARSAEALAESHANDAFDAKILDAVTLKAAEAEERRIEAEKVETDVDGAAVAASAARRAADATADIARDRPRRGAAFESKIQDDGATLDDLHEAVTTLEDTDRIARRVLGGAHPTTGLIEHHLEEARFTLAAFDAP